MDILVSHNSALEYWRTVDETFLGNSRSRRLATTRARRALASLEKPRLSSGNRRPAGCTLPLSVLASDARNRSQTLKISSSQWSSPLPEKSFVQAGGGLLVSTPEFVYLQMASRLSLAHLIVLAYELCGTYLQGKEGPASKRSVPLTSTSKLLTFVEKAPSTPGRKRALRALRYTLDNAASPMESILSILLCLPYALGGYALEQPKLNYRVDIPNRLRKLADREYCICDLCWPEMKLVVEYDSKLHHSDPERRESDRRRQSTLTARGFTVVSVSNTQIMDGHAFNRLSHQLARLIGKRLRYIDPDFTRKHLQLRSELFEAIGIFK